MIGEMSTMNTRRLLSTFFWAALLLLLSTRGERRLAAQNPQDHAGQYAQADIVYGSRVYAAQCATCHGADGAGVGSVNLRSGQFRRVTTDQEIQRLIATGIPGAGMPPFKFDNAQLAGLIAFIRNMNTFDSTAVNIGDPSRGRTIFEGQGGCQKCHMVNDKGSALAPDLSEIGAVRPPSAIERHLLDPTASMLPINRPIRATTRSGKVYNGRRLNEDTYSLQIIDDQEHLVSLLKSDLRDYQILRTSPMPSFKDTLRPAELADLVAYLLTLKGS
jgi:putative heme-binding domain-containing protein